MFGRTPPAATVTPDRNLVSSSSLRTARVMWRGMMRDFLLSRAALPRELKDLRSHVLEDGGEVHRGAGANARRVLAELHVAVDTANRELETGLGRARRRLLLRATTATLHHD